MPLVSESTARNTSSACLISIGVTSSPRNFAVATTSRISTTAPAASALAITAKRASFGTTSRNSSIRLPAVSVC